MDHLLMRRKTLDNLPAAPPLPEGYVLREYKDSDLEGLVLVLQLAFPDMSWTADTVRERLVDAPDVKKTFVVEFSGRPVATASVRIMPEDYPDSGYLHWVAVHPDHRGQQLGTIVSIAALNEFAQLGCKDAVLETEDERLAAIRVYKQLGFEAVHRHSSHALRWAMIAELLASANL